MLLKTSFDFIYVYISGMINTLQKILNVNKIKLNEVSQRWIFISKKNLRSNMQVSVFCSSHFVLMYKIIKENYIFQ